MAKITISDLQTAGALTGAEKIAVVQSGFTKQADLAGLPVSTATQTALNLKANQTSVDVLDDFRVWDSGRTYSINDPAFYLGIPYRAKTANTNKAPDANPTDWEVVGGGGAQIGNIAPDPAGSKGNAGWTGTVSTIANGLTGFATELQITADSIQTIPIPTQLQGEALELRFEAVVSSGTGITAKVYSDSGATVEIPMSSTGINATGKTAFVGSFWAVGANVYLKIAGTAFNLRATNFYIGRPETVQGAVVSEWQSYTPTFQGFGTPTAVDFKYRRNGSNVEIKGKFTSGTTTAVEAQVTLPSGLTSRSDVPTLEVVGSWASVYALAQSTTILNEASKTYFTFGTQNVSTAGLAKANGTGISSNGQQVSIIASIPCAQFTSSMTVVGMNEPFFLSNSESVVNTNGVAAKTQIGTWAPILANTAATYYDLTLPRPLMLGEKPKIILRSKVDGNSVPLELASVPSLFISSFRVAFESGGGAYHRSAWIAKTTSGQIRVYFGQQLWGSSSSFADANAVAARSWASVVSAADGYDAWMVEISRGGEAWAVPPVVYAEATHAAFINGRIAIGTVVEDTVGGWTTGASARYTFKFSGLYSIGVSRPNPGTNNIVILYKNGSLLRNIAAPSGTSIPVASETKIRVVAGDYIEFYSNAATTDSIAAIYQITRMGS